MSHVSCLCERLVLLRNACTKNFVRFFSFFANDVRGDCAAARVSTARIREIRHGAECPRKHWQPVLGLEVATCSAHGNHEGGACEASRCAILVADEITNYGVLRVYAAQPALVTSLACFFALAMSRAGQW